jgi:hypothetical protein
MLLLVIMLVLLAYLTWDFYPPKVIKIGQGLLQGVSVERAWGLVSQGRALDESVWASRGMWAYRHREEENSFIRQYRVPTGPTIYWLLNFSIMRFLTGHIECIELLPLSPNAATALSAGWIWHRAEGWPGFKRVLKLNSYGIGVGRGCMPAGFCRLQDGTVMLGEYRRDGCGSDTAVYASPDGGSTWKVAYSFLPGSIKHIHAVQEDPYSHKVWVCTGDTDSESMIMTLDADGGNSTIVGAGAQRWRAVQLVFAEDAVYWGADTLNEDNGLWQWSRKTGELKRIYSIEAMFHYGNRFRDGTMLFSEALYHWGAITLGRRKRIIGSQRRPSLWIVPAGAEEPVRMAMNAVRNLAYSRFAVARQERSVKKADVLWMSGLDVNELGSDLVGISLEALRGLIEKGREAEHSEPCERCVEEGKRLNSKDCSV